MNSKDCPDVVEYIETVVEKNEHGLGMTVVGYAADDGWECYISFISVNSLISVFRLSDFFI